MSVETFIDDLNKAIKNQTGRYFARVWGYSRSNDEADIYRSNPIGATSLV
jgi:hypothetical protein